MIQVKPLEGIPGPSPKPTYICSMRTTIAGIIIVLGWAAPLPAQLPVDGMVKLTAVSPLLPAAVRKELAAREKALIAGKAAPFTGRLVDQSGRVRNERGALSDDAIARMDWFVQGVSGTLPRP